MQSKFLFFFAQNPNSISNKESKRASERLSEREKQIAGSSCSNELWPPKLVYLVGFVSNCIWFWRAEHYRGYLMHLVSLPFSQSVSQPSCHLVRGSLARKLIEITSYPSPKQVSSFSIIHHHQSSSSFSPGVTQTCCCSVFLLSRRRKNKFSFSYTSHHK